MTAGSDTEVKRELDRLFRREAGRLVATLVKKLGTHNLSLAEDTAQDALAAAARTWPYDGLPDNPAAWLHTTAYRRALDALRHSAVARAALPHLKAEATITPPEEETSSAEIELLFICCQHDIPEFDRLALTLSIAFGFSAREIAQLFLVKPAAMSARLTRAKERINRTATDYSHPLPQEATSRVPSVLKVIYLAFSLGYSPGPGPLAVREDVALEALRLAAQLAAGPFAQHGGSHALAALLYLQASRLGARTDGAGNFVKLEDQNRRAWDHTYIAQGLTHLARTQEADELTRYHLEAGIAAAHAVAPSFSETDWAAIISLYETLEHMTASPIVTLNRAAALMANGENQGALALLDDPQIQKCLNRNIHYHTARAELLHRMGHMAKAQAAFKKARFLPGSDPDLAYLDLCLSALP